MTRSPNPSGEPSGQTRPGRRTADRAAAGPPIVELHKQLAARGPAAYKPPSRAQRLKRVAISLLGVVLLFCAYDLLAVPLIEPTADLRTTDEASPDDLKYASEAAQRQREELSAWFGPGDWEVSAPMVFWLPKGLLVLKSYETRPDHSVKIEPCTLVFLPQGQFTDEADRRRRAIVLQAPSAILRFDSDMDPQHAKIGKLIGGNLEGVITVRSDQREPGPHDDLLLTTRDMELVGDRLTTPHPVEFRLGQSAGRGRNLAITLAPADPASAQRGLTFGGMRSLELADSVWMRVQPGRSDLFPAPALSRSQQEEAAQTIGGALAPSGTVQPPLEVQCEGAFRFDLEKYEATFERTVVVSRANAKRPERSIDVRAPVAVLRGRRFARGVFGRVRNSSAGVAKKNRHPQTGAGTDCRHRSPGHHSLAVAQRAGPRPASGIRRQRAERKSEWPGHAPGHGAGRRRAKRQWGSGRRAGSRWLAAY